MARKVVKIRRPRFVIYGLTEPETHEVRYVGQTSDLMTRYKMHIHEAKHDSCSSYMLKMHPKSVWIFGLLKRGLHPGITILEATTSKDANVAERKWVMLLEKAGEKLVNKRPYPEPHSRDLMRALGVNGKMHALIEIAAELLEKHGDPCAAIYRRQATAVLNLTGTKS